MSRLCIGVVVSGLVLTLAGCEDGTRLGSSRPDARATAAADRPAATRLMERDVEAPEVFSRSEAGLWDGRPSLGGVWVAHPDVEGPERVVIRNATTGETVIGALFKRERDNPGPRFQVSSDAAAALGLLAGAPTRIDVTALRREETEAPAEDAEDAAPEVAAAEAPGAAETPAPSARMAPEDVKTTELSPIQRASAAIDRAEADATGNQDAPAAQETAQAETSEAQPDEATETATAAARERRGFFANLFRPRTDGPLRAGGASDVAPAEAGTIVTTPEISTDTPEPTPAAASAPARSQSAPREESYVQVGIFSVEANAEGTAKMMRRNGVVPTIYEQQGAGQTYWRVVAGPARTRSDRSALLDKVQGLGFTDAYAVSR